MTRSAMPPCLPSMPRSFPVSSDLAERGLYLPSFVGMSEADSARVADALAAVLS